MLLIDPNTSDTEQMQALFSGWGWVCVVQHTEEGLSEVLKSERFDVTITEIFSEESKTTAVVSMLVERGQGAPVLVCSAQAQSHQLAPLVALGVVDYVFKPYPSEELHKKITLAAQSTGVHVDAENNDNKKIIDLLILDDMPNVARKLRQYLPPETSVSESTDGPSALALARQETFRTVLMDLEIPKVITRVLLHQLRILQPQAKFVGLCLRNEQASKRVESHGFDGVLYKPFDAADVVDFLHNYFDTQDTLKIQENILTAAPYAGREERLEMHYQRISVLTERSLEGIAAACFSDVILDLTALPPRPSLLPRMVIGLDEKTKKMGLTLRLVGDAELRKVLKSFTDTAAVPFSHTVAEAQQGSTHEQPSNPAAAS